MRQTLSISENYFSKNDAKMRIYPLIFFSLSLLIVKIRVKFT